ncbi:uncharacterized protein [Argopecten irradians]|uniref:uncharacterized protein n=1 Tax=Argopecten irradians TaxID=31199 RepID=UPI003719DD6F
MADLKGQGSSSQTDKIYRDQNNVGEPCSHDPALPSDNHDYYLLYEHDPDLIVEVDIPLDDHDEHVHNGQLINGHLREPTSTRSNLSSGFAGRKTSSKVKQHSSLKTRGRPIKSHEMEPFLSVDNLPPEKQASRNVVDDEELEKRSQFLLEILKWRNDPSFNQLAKVFLREHASGTRSKSAAPRSIREQSSVTRAKSAARISIGQHTSETQPSGEIGKRIPDKKGFKLRNGRLTPASSVFITREESPKKVNHCIKNPFKHSVNDSTDVLNIEKGKSPDRCKTPSGDMKQRTTFATFHMGKVLAKSNTESPPKKQGKLLKGNTSRPVSEQRGRTGVTSTVPVTTLCTDWTGKVSVTIYSSCHTLCTDWTETIFKNCFPVKLLLRFLDDCLGSWTSCFFYFLQFSVINKYQNMIFRSTPPPSDRDVPMVPPASAASFDRRRQGDVSPDPRVFATEISTARTIPDAIDEIQAEELHNKLNLQNSTSNAKSDGPQTKNIGSDLEVIHEPNPILSRPQTAVSGQHATTDHSPRPHTAGQLQSRPHTASKSVRFAEDTTDKTTDKTTKRKERETCKPSDSGFVNKRDDDPDYKDGASDKGQMSGQGEIRLISAGTAASAESDKNTSKSNTQGKQQSLKSVSSETHQHVEKVTAKQAVCLRYDNKDGEKPSTLQVTSVGHGGKVHTIICPESPTNRSRSPSPQRRGQRSPSPQYRGQGLTNQKQQSKHNKSNRLVRPSSANMCTRPHRSHRSGNTRVCFEDDKPEHESIFIEKEEGDQVYIGIREDRPLTFEDIEAELRALQEDIQERRVTEEGWDVLQDEGSEDGSDVSTVVEDHLGDSMLGQSEQDQPAEDEVQQECWGDYSSLLDIYRRKCMDVSENCGEISNKLTTPRRSKVKQRCRSKESVASLKRKDSCQSVYTSDSGKGSEGVTVEESMVTLSHAASNLTLDSGLSLGDSDDPSNLRTATQVKDVCAEGQVLSGEPTCVTRTVPPLELHTAPKAEPQVQPLETELAVQDVDEDQTIVDTKKLLEIVCEELVTHQNKLKEDADMPLIPKVEPAQKEELKIVAEIKTLNKQKKKKPPRTGPIAPFAPVCFEINARPPKGLLYYFAYGTEMSLSRLTTYIKREPQRYWGLLFGFQLVFNKKGADIEAGGFANIEFNPYSSVEGCVYPITQQELLLLDKYVGYPQHYEHLVTPLWLMNSNDDPNKFGVAQYCVPALTFIAQDRWIETEERLDYSGSLSQCVKSSDMVTPGYHDHLVNLGASNSGREQTAAA